MICVHRGSQRKVCCGSPQTWICRLHRVDCVINPEEREVIIRHAHPAGQDQAKSVRVCLSCPDSAETFPDSRSSG